MKISLGWLAGAWLCTSAMASAPDIWTLEQALNYALEKNPDARLAQQRIVAARAELEQANAAFWPKLQLQSSYIRTDNPMLVFGSILNQRAYRTALDFNDVPDVDNFNAKGLVTAPLYAGGRNVADRASARATMQAAKYEHAAVRNALSFEVVRAFHVVLKTRRFIEAAEAAVRAFEANREIAARRLEGGSLLKSDLLDIEVRLAQGREDLVRARNANILAERALRKLLGIEEGPFAVAETAPVAGAPDSADFSQRAELAAARERERAAEAQVRGAKGGYLPRVSAFGSVDYDYGERFGRDGESYTAGIVAHWDLWDGHLTRAKIREAQAGVTSAREEQRKLRLQLQFEVEQARLDLQAANERLAVTDRTIAHSSESAQLIRARFEQGLALGTQLIDAETALVTARVRRAEAEADQRIAVAALRKALALPQIDPEPIAD